MTETSADTLVAAGWELAHTTLRMVTLPSELSDAEMFYWRSPDGRVLTEARAIKEVEQQAKGKKR